MTLCTNCNGEGLVGQGDKPWLKQGKLETCTACKGTGKISDEAGEQAPESAVNAEETASSDTHAVDNSQPSNLGDGSQNGSGGDANQEQSTPPVLG